MATFPVVLDACVLFNAPVRDTLLRAAEHGLYRVHWSEMILVETLISILVEQAGDLRNMTLDKLLSILQRHVPIFVNKVTKRLAN